MERIFPVTICRLPAYTGLDGESADNYYKAAERRAFLSASVVNPFSDSLRESTGYSDQNAPDNEVEVAREIGSLRFVVKVTPTKKRPGYKEVFEELDGYLRARLAEYKAGNRPVGVFTIDDQPYISAHEILGRIKNAKSRVTSKGVKIGVEDPELPSVPESISVPLGMDLGKLTEGNAARYMEAFAMTGGFDDMISALREELLGLTGFSEQHPPAQTEHMYRQIGSHVFHVASVPYKSISYGKVMNGLDSEPGKKDVAKGGDLVLVTMDVDLPRLKVYDTKQRDGDRLVRLKSLLKRIDTLFEKSTEVKIRQPIEHFPLV